jgi:molecular chaperone GrpE
MAETPRFNERSDDAPTVGEPASAAATESAAAAVAEQAIMETAAADETQLAALEAEIAKLKDERLRALAEIENVRRRAQRDRQDASQYAISGFARDLLSVADNLQRALASVDPGARGSDPALDALMSGVEMTERELMAIFERHGVKHIEAEGALFDPHVHEAMFEIPNPAVAQGTVLQVVQQGYLLHDRTLRPARVGIARGGPKPAAAEAASAAATGGEEGEVRVRTSADAYDKRERSEGAAGSRLDETL